jgi:uncharacterized membrane protein YqiK
MQIIGWIIPLLIILGVLIAFAAWFYQRATNEISLVRTGMGGRRVVMDGGILALPYFHEITRVNMQTARMDVDRQGSNAVISKDRMRIDIGCEFYISVRPEENAIVRAAQTLGRRTFQADQLKSLFDGMMIDALRSVASLMTMDELHEDRRGFGGQVRSLLAETLDNYGLQLESVSITNLDQTPFSALDENNAFNAVGMRKLAEIIAKSKKERAEIEGESQVSVRRAEVDANRRKLEIDLEQRRAEIDQTKDIEILLAEQMAQVANSKAQAETQAAAARIAMEQSIQTATLNREQALREVEIQQTRIIELAEQDRAISLAAKSEEGSAAKAKATQALQALARAEEDLTTVRQVAEADRRKTLALKSTEQEAESHALRVRITSQSDELSAKTRGVIKRSEAETLRIVKQAEADGEAARITSENKRSPSLHEMEMEKARLAALPQIIAEMVKPAEKIKGITVNHVTGLGRSNNSIDRPGSPIDHTVDAILDVAVALPTLKKIGDSIGLNVDGLMPNDKKNT